MTAPVQSRSELDGIERARWSRLRPAFLREWEAGQHVAIIGPTGSGKSYLALDLLEGRVDTRDASVLVLANKRRDPTLEKLLSSGWTRIREWPPTYEQRESRRIVLWPPYGKASNARANRAVFANALDEMIEEGGWTVYLDEAIYFTEQLGLRSLLDEYWNAARSSGITVVSSSQGTTWVPRAMLSQQRWAIVFRLPDEDVRRDAARIAGDTARFAPVIASLREHEFLLVRTRTGHAYVSKVGT